MPKPRPIFVMLLILSALQCAYYYPRMPETIASHFNGAGYPNDWSSKAVFFGIVLAMSAMNALVFLLMPKWFPRFSQERFNLPNRDYWLAPERIRETLLHIRTQMLWFGVATMMLMIGVTQMALEANMRTQPTLSSGAFNLLLVYFGFTTIWLTRLIYHFSRLPAGDRHRREGDHDTA